MIVPKTVSGHAGLAPLGLLNSTKPSNANLAFKNLVEQRV
jgi:hypothetical protein